MIDIEKVDEQNLAEWLHMEMARLWFRRTLTGRPSRNRRYRHYELINELFSQLDALYDEDSDAQAQWLRCHGVDTDDPRWLVEQLHAAVKRQLARRPTACPCKSWEVRTTPRYRVDNPHFDEW